MYQIELFRIKRKAKRILGQAVSDYGGADAVRAKFDLTEDQERWLANEDYDHQWTYERRCEVARAVPGLLPSSWVLPLYRQWLRWDGEEGAKSRKSASSKRCTSEQLFDALEVDAGTATLVTVRHARLVCLLKYHPDHLRHLSEAEQREGLARFLSVQDAWEELRKPGSVAAHREACAHRPSDEED